MDLNIRWYFFGSIAFLFAIIGLVCAIRLKIKGSQIMMFCSLSMGAFTVLEEVKMIWQWYNNGALNSFKFVPSIITTLNNALLILLGINLISLIVSVNRK